MADEDKFVTISFVEHPNAEIIKWHVKKGSRVTKGTPLFTCSSADSVNTKCKSSYAGTVTKILKEQGQHIEKGDDLLTVRICSHPIIMKEMCAECGADLKETLVYRMRHPQSASVSMVHTIPELKVSQEQAHLIGKADENHLLRSRKLALLVDLDQTLIHTTNDNVPPNLQDVFHFQLYGPRSPWYHTRLRPGTKNFLKNLSKLYELHICTFGARSYAHMIAHLLDQDGQLFSKRILSRDECFNPLSKTANLKALFPCGDSMVCIIDDREDVWNYAPNLVHVKPYHFFQHTGDINAPPGLTKTERDSDVPKFVMDQQTTEDASSDNSSDETEAKRRRSSLTLTKSNEDEGGTDQPPPTPPQEETDSDLMTNVQDDDDHLLHLEEKLRVVHQAYYEMFDQMKEQGKNGIPDIKYIVPYVQRKVLKNANVVFSGVIPTNMPAEKSRAWILAKSLGADIQTRLVPPGQNGDGTTHLIAARPGTVKVNEAKKSKTVHIVNPDWLWCCAERWERVSETLFPLTKSMSCDFGVQLTKSSSDGSTSSHSEMFADYFNEKNGEFCNTINPLLTLSSNEIADMDREVEDIINEAEESFSQSKVKRKDLESNNDSSKTDENPEMGLQNPRPDDDDESDESFSETSNDSADEEMAAAVEREFLAP